MITSFENRIREVFRPNSLGAITVVDEILTLCRDHGLSVNWQNGQCQVVAIGEKSIEFELPVSVFRAILARIAVLCNASFPESVSPYGGIGQILVDTGLPVIFGVTFSNKSEELSLLISRGRIVAAEPALSTHRKNLSTSLLENLPSASGIRDSG